jgi:hypothetical protein
MNLYFSQIFEVDPDTLESYGALDISLINDLPLFIDPFLLFNSEKPDYQALHREIIRYLSFLRDMARQTGISRGLIKEWFQFSEVKQTWLGYSLVGNEGRGLGKDFAESLYENLNSVLSNFGNEEITQSSHLEKLCLIKEGVGKDNISDFTTNLIKKYLLEYTQGFAQQYLSSSVLREVTVPRVEFNYATRSWVSKKYVLPYYNGDYVLLTPKDILAREDTWINHPDLFAKFQDIIVSVSDEQLRANLNQYFVSQLPKTTFNAKGEAKKISDNEMREAIRKTIQAFPQILDYYIAYKEQRGDEAISVSEAEVELTEMLFKHSVMELVNQLHHATSFYKLQENSHQAARARVEFLKDVIENKGGHRIFYIDGKPIQRERDLQVLFKLTWFASPLDISREVNDGRGPVDYVVSHGALDKTLVEFKLAKNTHLKRNLENQLRIYEAASNPTHKSLKVILYFSHDELERVATVLEELGLENDESIILIDARADNKPSGSKA